MKRTIAVTALSLTALLGVTNANAYLIFFGEDLNNSRTVPLATTPNASAAESSFLSHLTGVGTEDFESQAIGSRQPLTLNFPGFGGGSLSATLTGSSGIVYGTPPGTTDGFGRYSISSTDSSNYWFVSAGTYGNFTINFGQDIAAFGFYGIDIGDLGGQLQIALSNGDTPSVDHTVGANLSTDGSVLFFGLIAENSSELFDSIDFLTTSGLGDNFAFDRFTAGEQAQVDPVPEPATLALMGLGLAGIGFARKKKQG